MSEPLKPCPWCDTKPNMTDNIATDSGSRAKIGKWAWIECDCGARGPDTRANWGSVPDWQQDAADAWNSRAPAALPTREEVAAALCKAKTGLGCACAQMSAQDQQAFGWCSDGSWAYQLSADSAADAVLALMRERMG